MFEVGGNTAKLEFADGSALDGATVRVSLDMSVRDFLALQRAVAGLGEGDDALERWQEIYQRFGDDYLESWDLALKGSSLPADGDGVLSLPFPAARTLFAAWLGALSGPGPNSEAASDSSDTSVAELEAMAAS